MNAQQLWTAYREKSGVAHDNYTAWAFGGDPDGGQKARDLQSRARL